MGTKGCLDFYLGQLQRERTLLDESWKWMIWLIPGLVVLMAGAIANQAVRKAAPFLAITCLWIGTWLWMMLRRNKRKARALRQEIDELNTWGRPLP
jgi:uncharacterized membrane protein YfcA